MKKHNYALIIIGFIVLTSFTGKYITKNGKISFYSDAPLEKIEAKNSQVNAAIDSQSGAILFKVLIKSFIFEKALMQEHFNENYLESDKYPTAIFKGKITNLNDINFERDGSYAAIVKGKLTIHGVTKDISTTGMITIKNKGDLLNTKAIFTIKITDYGISIPGAVTGKIAEEVEISINADMKPLKK